MKLQYFFSPSVSSKETYDSLDKNKTTAEEGCLLSDATLTEYCDIAKDILSKAEKYFPDFAQDTGTEINLYFVNNEMIQEVNKDERGVDSATDVLSFPFLDMKEGDGYFDEYDLNPDKSLDIPYVSLETLYKSSDIISLHCPLTSDNYHMINSKSIRKMKDGVIIINTSRGGLVNSFDLYKGIISRKIGAVCLDVYEEEGDIFYEDKSNHIMNNQTLALLIGLPNVIVTSHQGFLTKEALHNIAETILQNILDYIDKRKSNNIVVS